MAEQSFNQTVESLFKGMDSFLSTKTVVGDAVKFDDGTIILPLIDVSFGVGAGAFTNGTSGKNNAGGGMGGKITPSSVLVIQNGHIRLVNVKNQDMVTKIIDMVPDVIDRFSKDSKTKKAESEVDQKAYDILNGQEKRDAE